MSSHKAGLLLILSTLVIVVYTRRSIRPIRGCECGIVDDNINHLSKRFIHEFEIGQIVGGEKATKNEYPWVVGLNRDYKCRGAPVCGGALISSQHIITAAHCIEDGTIECISLGDHDYTTSFETNSIQMSLMSTALSWNIHEDYDRGNATTLPRYDIALLILDSPINFTMHPNVRPLCLPDPRTDMDVEDGIDMVVAGWGLVGEDKGQSIELKKANITSVSNDACQSHYNNYPGAILDTHLCAYSFGNDACQGDSGGALFATRPKNLQRDNLNRMELVGITSFGQRCGFLEKPGGYTRASRFTRWIMKKMTDITEKAHVCNGTFGSWIIKRGK